MSDGALVMLRDMYIVQRQYRTEQKSHITEGMQQYGLIRDGVMRYMEIAVELYCVVV
jgi:hypothetical protein